MNSTGIKLTRIMPGDYEALAKRSGLNDEGQAMARRVLVDGAEPIHVAAEFGKTKQRVSQAVGRVRRAHQMGVTRSGWVTVEMTMPESLAVQVREFVAALQDDKASAEAKAQAMAQVGRAFVGAKATLSLA